MVEKQNRYFIPLLNAIGEPLSGTGCIWEYDLFQRGYNDLAPKDKIGVASCYNKAGSIAAVKFEACDATPLTLKVIH